MATPVFSTIDTMGTGSDEERKSAASRGWTVESPDDAPEPEESSSTAARSAAEDAAKTGLERNGKRGTDESGTDESGAEERGTDERGTDESGTDESGGQMSNFTVVMLGLTGGVSLLYAWVWMSWAQYYSNDNAAVAAGSGSLGGVLQQVIFWVAPLAPVLWFIAALALHRKEPRKLALGIALGLVVTFPIPMVASMGAAL